MTSIGSARKGPLTLVPGDSSRVTSAPPHHSWYVGIQLVRAPSSHCPASNTSKCAPTDRVAASPSLHAARDMMGRAYPRLEDRFTFRIPPLPVVFKLGPLFRRM